MRLMENPTQFVQWLRSVAPYIHAFRGKTFVVAFPGELVSAGALQVLAHDLSLLHALDINVTVVYGSRPQVAEQLALRNVEGRFHNGVRITDIAGVPLTTGGSNISVRWSDGAAKIFRLTQA